MSSTIMNATKRQYTKLSHLTEEEKAEYKRLKHREHAKRYREKNPDKTNIQTNNGVKKWYSNEENQKSKCLKNKLRWYLMNIRLLEEADELTTRQEKRLDTLKTMLNELVTNLPELLRPNTE